MIAPVHTATTDYPDFGLTADERRAAVFGHRYEHPGMSNGLGEIWGYTDALAYPPGATARLHVSSTNPSCEVSIVRDGANASPVLTRRLTNIRWQDTPDQCSVVGCGWNPSFEFRVGEEWPSGAYRVTLTTQNRDGAPLRSHHLFIVRPRAGRKPARILQIAATGTWTAYNTWGGSNHYQGITGPKRNQYATTVSTERPWCRGFVVLPEDAPRVPLEIAPPPRRRRAIRIWNGRTRMATPTSTLRPAGRATTGISFTGRSARDLPLIWRVSTNCISTRRSSRATTAWSCVGHDEYWTWEMRDAIDEYVERGGRVARFAGNFMWQTRLRARRQAAGLLQVPRARRGSGVQVRGSRREPTRFLGGTGDRAARGPDLRSQRDAAASTRDGVVARLAASAAFPCTDPSTGHSPEPALYYGDLLGADGPCLRL